MRDFDPRKKDGYICATHGFFRGMPDPVCGEQRLWREVVISCFRAISPYNLKKRKTTLSAEQAEAYFFLESQDKQWRTTRDDIAHCCGVDGEEIILERFRQLREAYNLPSCQELLERKWNIHQ